ncbi:MAG: O-antigen ligase family protein [Deltaproteobacteria bacterium]|nr:O-antigen ligase family protein [Deltaproteobacteria bacterium]
MFLDRSKIRPVLILGVLLVLLAGGVVLAEGLLQTVLFTILASSGVVLSAALWPEVLVMAYLFAGRYEYDARLAPFDLPLSVNQMMLVGLVGLALVNASHLGRVLRSWTMVTLLLFGLVMVLGLGWSYGLIYGLYKVTHTWLVVIPGVVIAATVVLRRRSLTPLIAATFLVGFALNGAALLTFEQSMGGNRLTGLGSGPIVFARTVGLSLLIGLLTLVWLVQRGAPRWRDRGAILLCVAAVGLLIPGFVLAQSRGPALGLAAALATVLVLSLYGNWRVMIAGVVFGSGVLWAANLVISTMLEHTRFDLTKESNQAGLDGRVNHLTDTWAVIVDNPLIGAGTGGWPVSVYGIDHRMYPHNFFAEIASENGVPMALLIGVLFAVILGRGFVAWLKAREPKSRFILLGSLATFAFYAVNISATGDTPDNRLVWLILASVELSARFAREQVTSQVVVARVPARNGPWSTSPAR